MLPEAFINRMQKMLKEEYPDFLQSYNETGNQALRLNPLKGDSGRFLDVAPFHLTPVPFAENGYYYEEEDRPGKHPFHEAGVYYIQEASAMAPVSLLDVKPGEKVLDLCAAPGGKSAQIGAAMNGEGILVCNEIHPARAGILSENIERMGITNAVVVNHSPDFLAERFPAYFDRILVDAPCSGEGMFRKNEESRGEWSPENVAMCAKRQDEILDCAAQMLSAGGRLVYSTCTFAPEENEGSVSRFLKRHPEFSVIPVKIGGGIERGRPEWVEDAADGAGYSLRLWPHKLKGEGHFAAALQKEGTLSSGERAGRHGFLQGIPEKEYKEFTEFQKGLLRKERNGVPLRFGDQLYLAPEKTPSLDGLRVLRPGLHLGTLRKNRFEPAHALALSLKPEEVSRTEAVTLEGGLARKYLRGETFETKVENGFCLIAVEGYSLGWGKAVNGVMKNHYPKGLRKNW